MQGESAIWGTKNARECRYGGGLLHDAWGCVDARPRSRSEEGPEGGASGGRRGRDECARRTARQIDHHRLHGDSHGAAGRRRSREHPDGSVSTRCLHQHAEARVQSPHRSQCRQFGSGARKRCQGKISPREGPAGFAQRTVAFDGPKLSVSNTFGGGKGFRDITATFEDDFTKCTSNVVTTIQGEFARQTKMSGGFEKLLSAKYDRFRCSVQDGNALAGS